MRVLVVGSGGREHTLCHYIGRSSLVNQVICAPGNGGILDENRRAVKDTYLEGIVDLAKSEKIDFVVIGPEAPLVAGLVDRLRENGIRTFGPSQKAARLEASKVYTKHLCTGLNIPTARCAATTEWSDAQTIISEIWCGEYGCIPVIKADGLCAGKGVIVPDTKEEALEAAHKMLVEKTFGDAGSMIVIEDRLYGNECSVMALCDGENAVLLPPSRDYKRARDGNKGLNTGGMGAYSPLPDVDKDMLDEIRRRIIVPIVRGMKVIEKAPFHGCLYAGIMLTEDGPYLLEFNVRFGDPETQVVLPRIQSDIVKYLLATTEPGGLARLPALDIDPCAAVCITLASKGYPGKYTTGKRILVDDDSVEGWGTMVFHAGTDRTPLLVTSGGRVMGVVGLGPDHSVARDRAEGIADTIYFRNKYRRKDIALNI